MGVVVVRDLLLEFKYEEASTAQLMKYEGEALVSTLVKNSGKFAGEPQAEGARSGGKGDRQATNSRQ